MRTAGLDMRENPVTKDTARWSPLRCHTRWSGWRAATTFGLDRRSTSTAGTATAASTPRRNHRRADADRRRADQSRAGRSAV
jgi:hypothetical protein